MLKVLELFSGTGCQVQALKNIGIECVSTQCEIDKYAVNTYNQLHGETPNLGDISKVKVEDLKEGQFDLITYSSPCQDFSVAGLGRGGDKGSGTRSSLLFECEKIIRKVRPKYLLFENVKNLLSEKHVHNFMEWLKILEEMGYCSYYDVLNAKDFGIPQNRERIFCVSILGKHVPYVFPQKQPLKLRLKDMLEDSPDEKYYIKKEISDKFKFNVKENKNDTDIDVVGNLDVKGFDCCRRVYDTSGSCPSITAGGGDHVHKIIDEPMICASRGRNPENPSDRTVGSPTEQMIEINKQGVANTLTTVQKDNLVIEPIKNKRLQETIEKNKGKIDDVAFVDSYNKKVSTDGLCGTITTRVNASNCVHIIEPINTETDGTCRTIKAQYYKTSRANFINQGKFGATGVKEIIKHNIVEQVKVRKYPVDVEKLKQVLKESKKNSQKTNEEIATLLQKPITNVEHWFRNDSSFSIPTEDIWFKLKEILNITTTEFDASITEFIIKDNEYDVANRAYNENGISPTLTTLNVPKVMEEPKIERIGGMYGQATRWGVYSEEGISPTITASMGLGGGHVPMVEEKQERLSKQAYETLEENKCKDGDVINPFNKKVVDDGICPTITTRPEGFKTANLIVVDESIEPNLKKKIEKEKENIANSNKDIYNIKSNSGFNDNAIGLKISPTIRAARPSSIGYETNNNEQIPQTHNFRIRKLTVRECWRLMGWKDEQFDKIKGISNAQLYKMAGNGIVINVLEAIFTNMFLRKPSKEEEKFVVDKPLVQLDLF